MAPNNSRPRLRNVDRQRNIQADARSAFRLLYPGLGLKRWLLPLLVGLVILGLGIGLFLRELYAEASYPPLLRLLLLQELPRWIRGIIFSLIGVGLVGLSLFQLNKMLLEAFLPQQATVGYVADQVYRHRRRRRNGPNVVAVGGGTGLSVLLSGLKHYTDNITAIVTVADDGGSSGKLRRELGVLPPGDFRNCITALADDEALTTQLFQYRFPAGGLSGHSFGNLFITTMAEVTGSFVEGLSQSGRVLNIRGTILPSTLQNVTLYAEVDEGTQIRTVAGESAIPAANAPIERVYLEPDSPRAYPPAVQAILNADLIVAGPGSLYTSVLPNLLVTDIMTAIRVSKAQKIYICNVATQPGETDGYTVDDHVRAIEAHTQIGFGTMVEGAPAFDDPLTVEGYLFKHVLVNNNYQHPIPPEMSHLATVQNGISVDKGYEIVGADVIDEAHPWRHDASKLANQLMYWYNKAVQT